MQKESKDPAMKLFGRTIPLILTDFESSAGNDDSVSCGGGLDCQEIDSSGLVDRSPMIEVELKLKSVRGRSVEDPLKGNPNDTEQQVGTPQPSKEDSVHKEVFIEANDDTSNRSINEGKDRNDTTDSQEKQLKRPDKLLPCPRCNSMDTKFCYYNNYNVLQPRHFCKTCQRYWTSGGIMRNVPVGAGRRRNKNVAILHYNQITIAEALTTARTESSNIVHGLRPTLNIINEAVQVENGEDLSTGSSITVTNSTEEMGNNCVPSPSFMPNFSGYAPHFQYLPPCFHWPYLWNPQAPPPPFFHPTLPMPFYPPTFMNAPWSACPATHDPNPQTASNSTTLGKRSREYEEPAEQKIPDRSIWVPKTLRFDDPKEAAKSSIWKTLGIKNNSISEGGNFKAFQPKTAEKSHVSESCPLLLANPAALSRSVSFRESF